MSKRSKTVVAVIEDLFFTVKIADAAKRAGLQAVFCKTEEAVLEKMAEPPLLVVLDLNCGALDTVELIAKLKTGDSRTIPLIGFVSHVQVETKQKALAAGCDMVLARSAFSINLPQIFRRHAGLPASAT